MCHAHVQAAPAVGPLRVDCGGSRRRIFRHWGTVGLLPRAISYRLCRLALPMRRGCVPNTRPCQQPPHRRVRPNLAVPRRRHVAVAQCPRQRPSRRDAGARASRGKWRSGVRADLRVHDLHHSLASALANAGTPERPIGAVPGHRQLHRPLSSARLQTHCSLGLGRIDPVASGATPSPPWGAQGLPRSLPNWVPPV